MPEPTNLSPNTGNYYCGKGIVKFKKEGEEDYRDLGDVSELEFTPSVEKMEHFSHRKGTRFKDASFIRQKQATLRMKMDEVTAENLAIVVMGNVDVSGDPPYSISIMDADEVRGALRFVGQNDIGAKIQMDIPTVVFTPSASFSPLSDELASIEATGEVLGDTDTGIFGTILWGITEEVV